MENLTCTSWLNGKHSADIEIIINEINEIYNNEKLNFTPLQACEYWASNRL